MYPLLPTSPLSNETTNLSENRSNQGKNPEQHSPDSKNSIPPGPWVKSDCEKVELLANHLAEVFTPYDNTLDPEVEREFASQIQHSE